MNELTKDEVADRLDAYPSGDTETTQQLYALGEMMLKENNERAGALDAKATNILGYAGVILAFLLAHSKEWTTEIGWFGKLFLLVAAVSSFGAAIAAFRSFSMREWRWFSDKEWFKSESLGNVERLRRFHILAMHEVNQVNGAINKDKAESVTSAQWRVAIATGSLSIALAIHILASWL